MARILPLEEQPQNEKVEMDGWMHGVWEYGEIGGMGARVVRRLSDLTL